MNPSGGSPSLLVSPAQDRPGLLVHFDQMTPPSCRPLPRFNRQADRLRLGVFLEDRLVTHTTLDPLVWEDMVQAGWLDHPFRLMLHVNLEGAFCLVAQWYLVGAIRAPQREGAPAAEASGWLPRMLTFPQIHSRLKEPVYGTGALTAASARLALELAYGLGHDMTFGNQESDRA